MKTNIKYFLYAVLMCTFSIALQASEKGSPKEMGSPKHYASEWATQLSDIEKIVGTKVGDIVEKKPYYLRKMITKLAEKTEEEQKDAKFSVTLKNNKNEQIGNLFFTLPTSLEEPNLKIAAYIDCSAVKSAYPELYTFVRGYENTQKSFNSVISPQQPWYFKSAEDTAALTTNLALKLSVEQHTACLIAAKYGPKKALDHMNKNLEDFPVTATSSKKRKQPSA